MTRIDDPLELKLGRERDRQPSGPSAHGPGHVRKRPGLGILVALLALLCLPGIAAAWQVPILAYHRFGPKVTDGMTVRTQVFKEHLEQMHAAGYQVIPLRQLVDHLTAGGPPPPPRAVILTVDDAHRTVYSDLLPLVLRHRIPVTLFVYPSAISNADYAMTWAQLGALRATGLFDIQSHTYWHPHFPREKHRLPGAAYGRFVDTQLTRSKQVLEQQLGGRVDLLAWPFGLHDADLRQRASRAGYVAAFTLERRPARDGDNPLALPRYLITDTVRGKAFEAILKAAAAPPEGNEQ